MKVSAIRPLPNHLVVKVTSREVATKEGLILEENDNDLILYGQIVSTPSDSPYQLGEFVVFHALDNLLFSATDAEDKTCEFGFVKIENILARYAE